MKPAFVKFLCIYCLLSAAPVSAADGALEQYLPSPVCAEGWVKDGKVTLYNRGNLFERINGESELYFPYGFEQLAFARYTDKLSPQTSIEADIYTMGSLLDAFGMYANYRRKDDPPAKIGGDGSISDSQLFFYQGRYLVRLQGTGTPNPPPSVFMACARAISRNLPPDTSQPKELEVFAIPGVVKNSQRYIAASLLGYDFFRRGLMADVVIKGEEAQLFLVTEKSQEAARKTIEAYRSYLESSGNVTPKISGPVSMEAVDPLYGPIVVEQVGRYVLGVVKSTDRADAHRLIGLMKTNVEKL